MNQAGVLLNQAGREALDTVRFIFRNYLGNLDNTLVISNDDLLANVIKNQELAEQEPLYTNLMNIFTNQAPIPLVNDIDFRRYIELLKRQNNLSMIKDIYHDKTIHESIYPIREFFYNKNNINTIPELNDMPIMVL